MGRCVITDGCHGKLHQFDFIQDGIVGKLTPDVTGLTNYVQRKVLFTFEQTLSSDVWEIEHNLNGNPSVQTFVVVVEANEEVLTEVTPDDIVVVDANNIEIHFATAQKGIAQLISRSSNLTQVTEQVVAATVRQVTIGFELSIATLSTANIVSLRAQFFSPTTLDETALVTFEFDNTPQPASPWFGANQVFIGGKLYEVRSQNVETLIEGSNVDVGSPFIFTGTTPEDVFILLSNPPHETFDRDFNNAIDISSATDPSVPGFSTGSTELLAAPVLIDRIFPPIHVI